MVTTSLGFRIDFVVKCRRWVVVEGWGQLLLERKELFALAVNAGRLATCVDQHVLSSFPLLVSFNPLSWEESRRLEAGSRLPLPLAQRVLPSLLLQVDHDPVLEVIVRHQWRLPSDRREIGVRGLRGFSLIRLSFSEESINHSWRWDPNFPGVFRLLRMSPQVLGSSCRGCESPFHRARIKLVRRNCHWGRLCWGWSVRRRLDVLGRS